MDHLDPGAFEVSRGQRCEHRRPTTPSCGCASAWTAASRCTPTGARFTDLSWRRELASWMHPRLTRDAPLLAVLPTVGDGPRDWLSAGHSLASVLLSAAAEGVRAGYANQPCRVPGAVAVRAVLAAPGHPQPVLRMGTPARPGRPRADPVHEVMPTGPRGDPAARWCREAAVWRAVRGALWLTAVCCR